MTDSKPVTRLVQTSILQLQDRRFTGFHFRRDGAADLDVGLVLNIVGWHQHHMCIRSFGNLIEYGRYQFDKRRYSLAPAIFLQAQFRGEFVWDEAGMLVKPATYGDTHERCLVNRDI